MYPMYGWTDSYPRPRNEMFYPPYHTPGFEAVPPHIKMDPARPLAMFEPWSYGGSYGYSYPTECHGCCNHNYFLDHYGFRPPYPHFPPPPPPPPHNHHGSYPAFFGGYPGYQIPPPHYSMEKPRYKYDKSFPNDQHCCGCPNHPCMMDIDKNVRIEEQEADVDKKGSSSLVPSHLKNYPFPFVMVPPGYLMDSEGSKSTKVGGKEENKNNSDTKCDKSSKPLNMSTCGPVNEKETQSQRDIQNQFPFPLFWLPYKPDEVEKEDLKEENKNNRDTKCDKSLKPLNMNICGPVNEKETQSQRDIQNQFPFPLFWLPYKPDEVEKEDLKGMNSGHEAVVAPFPENNGKVKTPSSAPGPKMMGIDETQMATPVKKMDPVEEKKKNEERKVKGIPVVQADDNRERKSVENSAKKQASSPKASKLPPVCLRVDPPSKSKKVNGSSRSPSPPADRVMPRQSPKDSGSLGQNVQSQNQGDKSKEVESQKKTIKVAEGTTTEDKREAQTSNHVPSHEEVSSRKSGVEGFNSVVNQDVGEATKSEEARSEVQSRNKEEANKVRRKMLSDSEAAVTIQSVYRGYEVRKSEPLKKLRQIAEVTRKVSEVKAHISSLDSCSDIEIDEKKLVSIGETIMSLLLRLDTIQGLHSTVRDTRKTVAKELVNLQEKLDSLTTRKAQAPIVPPAQDTIEGPTTILAENVGVVGNPNEVEVELDSTDREAQSGNKSVENEIPGPECVEMSEAIATEGSANNTSDASTICSVDSQRLDASSVDTQRLDADQEMELEEQEQKHQALDIGQQVTVETQECLEVERSVETPVCSADDKTDPEGEVADSSSLVGLPEKTDEATELIKSPHNENIDTEIDVAPRDDPVLEIEAASENVILETDQLEHVDGNEEENKNVAQESQFGPEAQDKDVGHAEKHDEVVSEMEGGDFCPEEDREIRAEVELYTPVKEHEAADIVDNLKEANITQEVGLPVVEEGVGDVDNLKEAHITQEVGHITQEVGPLVVEEGVGDGETKEVIDTTNFEGESNEVHPLPDEKEIPMQNSMVDQPCDSVQTLIANQDDERPGNVDMKWGAEMVKGGDRELTEENTRLKEMMEKLIEAGNQQLETITRLSGKVKDLEKKLSKNRKLKTKRQLKTKRPRGKHQDMVVV